MERIIKFRGMADKLHPCNKLGIERWIYGYYMHNDTYGDMPHAIFDIDRKLFLPVRPETVGQFTEYYANGGTEIYAGDILRYKHEWESYLPDSEEAVDNVSIRTAQVIFRNGKWLLLEEYTALYNHDYNYEIIGNIYENPELLQ